MRPPGHGFALTLAALVLGVWAATMALAVIAAPPPAAGGRVVALFPPGRTDTSFAAIIRSGGRPVGASWAGLVWAVDADASSAHRLKAEGAIVVLRDFPFAGALGCAAATSVPQASPARGPAAR